MVLVDGLDLLDFGCRRGLRNSFRSRRGASAGCLDGEQVVGPGTQLGESDSAQEGLQAVPLHEGEHRLEEVAASQRRKLVEHQKEAVTHLLGMKILGQSPSDLVEQQAYQRLGAAGGRRPSLARPGESV